jgi:hypothetical protein
MQRRRIDRGLGWFSLALGTAELVAPRRIARMLGVRERNGLIRSYGLREVAAGLGLLGSARSSPWLWARVAGDAVDLGTLAAARRRSARPSAVGAALAGVAAVTALDLAAAGRRRREEQPTGAA